MKHRYTMILAAAATLLVLGSCELALGPRSEGTIILNLGGGPASRAFSDAPFDGLPVFSSVTVTVSGSGMPTASQTVPGTAASVTLQVPAGPARKVEVYAAVDWASTPQTPQPTLAKAYGGTVIVDVAGGQKVGVSMDMGVVETKIVLPDRWGASRIADSLSGPVTNPGGFPFINEFSILDADYEFDRFGRLFISRPDSGLLSRYHDLSVGDGEDIPVGTPSRLAYDRNTERLYFAYLTEGIELRYYDLMDPVGFEDSVYNAVPDLNIIGSGIAVDSDGYVYLPAYYAPANGNIVAKLSIVYNGEFYESRLAGYSTFDDLGLGYWITSGEPYFENLVVEDMRFQEGVLYIAAGEHDGAPNSPFHRGKIVAVQVSDMSKFQEIGWAHATYEDPIQNPATQFYGPKRFLAIVPRKLVFADEGNDGTSEINRVVEVDLDSWSVSGIGLEGVVTFFSNYSC